MKSCEIKWGIFNRVTALIVIGSSEKCTLGMRELVIKCLLGRRNLNIIVYTEIKKNTKF